jgi:hypothetical protein
MLTQHQHYGDILAQESHRYGEAMWYYALAHRPGKVREVMNLLTSYSLMQSTVYPPEEDLDDHLARLLHERNVTLERFAKQDMEAANLLGRMLSGYATLRRFYETRDDETVPPPRRHQQCAALLAAVVASADDNIRGGLYDPTRDAVVSEDFLLALLGEMLALVDAKALDMAAVDVLLKAAEDVEAVGSRVRAACDEFFQLVLHSVPGGGPRGGAPADLMRRSSALGGSYVLGGSSMLASQLHRSLSGGSLAKSGGAGVKRGWDWRTGVEAGATGAEVLRRLRVGVAGEMARLWVMEADGLV